MWNYQHEYEWCSSVIACFCMCVRVFHECVHAHECIHFILHQCTQQGNRVPPVCSGWLPHVMPENNTSNTRTNSVYRIPYYTQFCDLSLFELQWMNISTRNCAKCSNKWSSGYRYFVKQVWLTSETRFTNCEMDTNCSLTFWNSFCRIHVRNECSIEMVGVKTGHCMERRMSHRQTSAVGRVKWAPYEGQWVSVQFKAHIYRARRACQEYVCVN